MCADFTALRCGRAEIMTEDDVKFVRLTTDDGMCEIADRSFGHPALGGAVLRLRTDGDVTVRLAKYDPENVLAKIDIRDTNMEWTCVPFEFEGDGDDSTILFYTVTGRAGTVDLHYLKLIESEERS